MHDEPLDPTEFHRIDPEPDEDVLGKIDLDPSVQAHHDDRSPEIREPVVAEDVGLETSENR